jgi:hypothetical protein
VVSWVALGLGEDGVCVFGLDERFAVVVPGVDDAANGVGEFADGGDLPVGVLSKGGAVTDGWGGSEASLCELALGGDEFVDDLALRHQ